MADNNRLKNLLVSHPRLIGGLFTVMLLLSQSGVGAAGCYCSDVGP